MEKLTINQENHIKLEEYFGEEVLKRLPFQTISFYESSNSWEGQVEFNLNLKSGELTYNTVENIKHSIEISDEMIDLFYKVDILVSDCLRRDPHPTHAHLALTLEWINRVRPAQSVITNMHLDMDYDTLSAELPKGVRPAFDGMVLTFENVA